jgi:hypothetical protein
MRELTKSMLSFSLAVPLFGMKQMMAIALPRDPSRPFGQATDCFDAVTGATAAQMDGAWKSAFQAGDRLQRGMVDMMLGMFTGDSFDLNRMLRMSSNLMQTSVGAAGALGKRLGDCGCGPAAGGGSPPGAGGGGSAFVAAPAASLASLAPPASPVGNPPASAAGATASGGAAGAGAAASPPPGWTVSVPRV